ncbi:S-protein homolog 29-like [Rhododendron vialii]|uniref:S-protein homolog 29-like n=1 Tax=Rhododendron vialii TaxID=182163 RepID=UPI00265E0976|nr:S-protein homolog 29-like [Rhododendron vialii]
MARFLPLAIVALHFVSLQTFCDDQQQQWFHLYAERAVYIINNVPNPPLKFRCQSKGYDLLNRTITKGQVFSWTFRPGLFLLTRYSCHFYCCLQDKSIDVYSKQIDQSCKDDNGKFNCYYRVQPDGLYFSNDNLNYKLINDWGPPKKTASTTGHND